MVTVIAFALFMQFTTGPITLGALPTLAECNRLGTLLKAGNAKITFACLQYSMVIATPTGNYPALCTGSSVLCAQ